MATKQKKKKTPPPAPVLPYAPPAGTVNSATTSGTSRYTDAYSVLSVGKINEISAEGTQAFLVTGKGEVILRIEVWSNRCIRFRYGRHELQSDFSYARKADATRAPATVKLVTKSSGWELKTTDLVCKIAKSDGSITIKDRQSGQIVHEYAMAYQARTTLMKGLDFVGIQLKTEKNEGFFGLGDKSWNTDLHGKYFQNWCTDSFGYHFDSDNLYRAIPFFMGLRKGIGYGIFLDNTYRTHFDFNSNQDGLTTIWADGGEFDYYFFLGPALTTVATDYAQLTGLPELPPLWAMGFHQCRWSYYPEARVRELAANFREKKIPCDSIYLDIDYMDGYRCFTWNKEHFPDPKGMIGDLKADGFHTVVMIDPGIRKDEKYSVYQSGTELDVWCKRKSGEDMEGPVWPPVCVWPDYTDPAVREWWGPLYKELYVDQGVSGFWNDMNEPAMFKVNHLTFPDDVYHDLEGRGADHKEAHNIYGMQMARATYDGLKELQPAKRPFLLCRANYSGGQRYAALWTGDNVASWDHLAMANRQCIRLSISGYSFVGTDIGGFVDDPTGELMVRWLQLAIFHPVMRIHSMGNNADGAAEAEAEEVKKAEAMNRQDQEPWVFGEPYTTNARKAIEQRYRLLPYLYTAFRQHLQTGKPLLRNLFFEDQTDPQCRAFGDQFICGDDVLVAPVVKPGAKSISVYLPKGDWYDFYKGKHYAGGAKYKIATKTDRIPMFVRAGSIIPTVKPVQHTGELAAAKELELTVYLGTKKGHGQLYWDAGEGYGYESGDFIEANYHFKSSKKKNTIYQLRNGKYDASFRQVRLLLVGLDNTPKSVKVDGRKADINKTKRGLEMVVPFGFKVIEF